MSEITKISKEGWQEAVKKWTKAQELTRKKKKWYNEDGWENQSVHSICSYCAECPEMPDDKCTSCSLFNKKLCSGWDDKDSKMAFWKYVAQMRAQRTNWKLANQYCDEILQAILDDGVSWGYIKEKIKEETTK